ncbi:MAG: hypothetical protein V4584_01235 [Verrucomicrobiota bacterium]
MNQNLERYLNDHLAGSSGAIVMIQHFIDTLEDPAARDHFLHLKGEVEADRALLERLMTSAGMSRSGLLNAAGDVTARVGFLKLMWEGFEPGGLGMFEGLEMIALGIQGKRLLWLALREIAECYPEWEGVNFSDLERNAIDQRNGVELWRLAAARDTLASAERRAASHPVGEPEDGASLNPGLVQADLR